MKLTARTLLGRAGQLMSSHATDITHPAGGRWERLLAKVAPPKRFPKRGARASLIEPSASNAADIVCRHPTCCQGYVS